jgi:hypothetical protein
MLDGLLHLNFRQPNHSPLGYHFYNALDIVTLESGMLTIIYMKTVNASAVRISPCSIPACNINKLDITAPVLRAQR